MLTVLAPKYSFLMFLNNSISQRLLSMTNEEISNFLRATFWFSKVTMNIIQIILIFKRIYLRSALPSSTWELFQLSITVSHSLMKNYFSNIWAWSTLYKEITCPTWWVNLASLRILLIERSSLWRIIMSWPFIKSSSLYVCIERILFLLKGNKIMSKEFTMRLNLNSNQTVTATDEACQETKSCTKVKFSTTRAHFRDKSKLSIKETKKKLKTLATASDHN